MILKVYFKLAEGCTDNKIIIPFNNQKELNSFIYRTLGDNNPYHDRFSDYSISSIQGGRMHDKDNLIFDKVNPYIQVASENMKFIGDLINGLSKKEYTYFNLQFDRVEFLDFAVNNRFDVIFTISPVIVKNENGIKVSVTDDNFLSLLKKNCIDKLRHKGIEDDTFDLVIRHKEKAKQKMIMVGDIFNICSQVSFYVCGKPNTRKTLYNLGLGGSTGSGFGAVKVYN